MKLFPCVVFVLIFLTLSPMLLPAQTTPLSARSREVTTRMKPELSKALSVKKMSWGAPVYIRIFKAERCLEVWLERNHRFQLFKSYPICHYGGMGLGPKTAEGDGRAPEGFYEVFPPQMNPFSRFHLSFNLGYPNAYDRIHGRTGSALMVHGGCVSIGCFAMTNRGIEEIYTLAEAALNHGQGAFKVHIFPFRLTPEKVKINAHGIWDRFWRNLKRGYDLFEQRHVPPETTVKNGRHLFKNPLTPNKPELLSPLTMEETLHRHSAPRAERWGLLFVGIFGNGAFTLYAYCRHSGVD